MTSRSRVEARTSPSRVSAWRKSRSRARGSSTEQWYGLRYAGTRPVRVRSPPTGPWERSLMPKYEYACKSCGEHTEVTQSFSDPPLTECPACGGPLRKVFSPPGIAFKGSGFYRTDNRKRRTEPKTETKTDAAASGSESKSDGESKSEPAKKEA